MSYKTSGHGELSFKNDIDEKDKEIAIEALEKGGYKVTSGRFLNVSYEGDCSGLLDVYNFVSKYVNGTVYFCDCNWDRYRIIFDENGWHKEDGHIVYGIDDVFPKKHIEVMYEALCEYTEGNDDYRAYDLIKILDGRKELYDDDRYFGR